ncbi:Capsid protein [Euphorbia peplus]|nr:Capsid protein [Euphorbia peplus]
MGKPEESSDSNNPSGLTSLNALHSEVNNLLENFHAKGIVGDSPEQRKVLAGEVGKLVNERLDAVEREKGLKGTQSFNKPLSEKDILKLRQEKMVPYMIDPNKKAANSDKGNLAQDLRKSLGLVEEVPLHIDDRTFNELLTTKRSMYKPNYPHRMKPEFVPRDNPLRPVISPSAFLNLDCEKHPSERIDEWITMIRFTIQSGSYTPDSAYELCKATMVGNAQKYWEMLVSHTPIREEIQKEVLTDEVLAIVVDALKREFCGFSLSTESLEKEQSLMALMKLQICDMCYFDNFACEFQRYYYNLDMASQNYMSEMFFAKLPEPWPEVAKTAFNLLLNEEKVVDGLGGRIEAVRYAMRKACTELQVRQDAKRLPYLNKSCCSQIEYVPGRYGCSSGSEEKPRTNYSSRKKNLKVTKKEKHLEKRENKRKGSINHTGLFEKELTSEIKIGLMSSKRNMVENLNVLKENP